MMKFPIDPFNDTYKAIVRSQNTNGSNLGAFVFDIPKEVSITRTQDITDHWTESGGYINDHSTQRPIEITLSGQVSELAHYIQNANGNVFAKSKEISKNINHRLTALGGLLGTIGDDLTPQAKQNMQKVLVEAERKALLADNLYQRGENLLSSVTGGKSGNHQKDVFDKLNAYFERQTPLKVLTPWKEYENMAITELSFTEGEETDSITDISITLKQLRFAEIKVVPYTQMGINANRHLAQITQPVDLGEITGVEVKKDKSTLFGIGQQFHNFFKWGRK